jgi:hypothetical protein
MASLFYQDDKVKLYKDDVLSWALDYKKQIDSSEALPFNAVLCDPPYGLSEPPPIDEILQAWLSGERYEYNKGGMMNHAWDSLPPGPQIWRALYDITYPGGYLFAFSSTRTADLLSIACRLGGWEPFDRIASFAWVQSQGMKKGADISKKLDKETGAEREVVGEYQWPDGKARDTKEHTTKRKGIYGDIKSSGGINDRNITAPATPLARLFHGYGTDLAPKHEPILLFRKPREGRTFAACARKFGSGGLHIEACRVASDGSHKRPFQPTSNERSVYGRQREFQPTNAAGRWPPNVHFSHVPHDRLCPACNGEGLITVSSVPVSLCENCLSDEGGTWLADAPEICPDCGGRTTDRRMHDNKLPCSECYGEGMVGGCVRVGSKRVKGTAPIGRPSRGMPKTSRGLYNLGLSTNNDVVKYTDPDGKEQVDDWLCVPGCPVLALDEMAGERKSGGRTDTGKRQRQSGFAMTGGNCEPSTGSASRFYPCHDWSLEIAERLAGETPFFYCPKASPSERQFGLPQFLPRTRNPRKRRRQDLDGSWLQRAVCRHPTLKPMKLIIWLATLLRPPVEVKPRICIPFAGAMSEAIAARLAGWNDIHAIEREDVYCAWGAARYRGMSKWAYLTQKTDPAEIRKLAQSAEARESWQNNERQTTLWEFLD